jgi:hypothetical protein
LVVIAICIAIGYGVDYEADTTPVCAIIGVVIGLGLTALFGYLAFGTEDTVTFKVEGKERIAEDGDGKWLVYASNGETYENTDAWFHGKTRSTDLNRDVVVGHTLRCEINGFRSGLLSSYKNLLKCTDLTTGKKLRSG